MASRPCRRNAGIAKETGHAACGSRISGMSVSSIQGLVRNYEDAKSGLSKFCSLPSRCAGNIELYFISQF